MKESESGRERVVRLLQEAGRPLRTRDLLAAGVHPRDLYAVRDAGVLRGVMRGMPPQRDRCRPEGRDLPEMPLREGPARAGFQVGLEASSLLPVRECGEADESPGTGPRRVGRATRVVDGEPPVDIVSETNVGLRRAGSTA